MKLIADLTRAVKTLQMIRALMLYKCYAGTMGIYTLNETRRVGSACQS
jgi:hypothetical protein